MLQVETLVSACAGGSNDRKIACETLAADHTTDPPQPHPDSPPESFWLSRDEEYDWWDRNAVYERKESTKANSSSTNLNPGTSSTNNSQRFSVNYKSKASTIIGLPKPQKTSFVDAKNRRNHKPSNIRLFPKRSVSVGKSETGFVEPSSPKVSCMGRVRSKRDRNRKLMCSRKDSQDTHTKEKPNRNRKKPGFLQSIRAIFRSNRKEKPDRKPDSNVETKSVAVSIKARDSTSSVNDASFEESITVSRHSVSENEPPGLGGMMRFASGRRSESWGVGDSEGHVPR
ncbi:unnamed protein product [Sphenostylis stenocarpa]|uniref:Uncharacterized protein n=1 Tax=Sphenostylis stenocarpa TaxID=92480 RepID=A0AA86RQE9_9FABA|nr:unnamed protein product [Sphenostylis stenocarpa]